MPAKPPPAPPAPPPEPPQDLGQDGSATSRLLKAQAAELVALRRRVAGLPEPDELEAIKAKAERFDQLTQQLPAWQEQVKGLFEAQQQQLHSELVAERQQLQGQRLTMALSQAFTAAGGVPQWAEAFCELHSKSANFDADGNLLLAGPDGASVPVAQAMDRLRTHPQWSYTFRPSMGSGSGIVPGSDVRVKHGHDLSRMSTTQRFEAAFGSGGTS